MTKILCLIALLFNVGGCFANDTLPKFELAFHLPQNTIDSLRSSLKADYFLWAFPYVEMKDGCENLRIAYYYSGRSAWEGAFISLDRNGSIGHSVNIPQFIFSANNKVGLQIRRADSTIYLAALEKNAFCMTEDSITICENPYYPAMLRKKYPNIEFVRADTFSYDGIAMFRIADSFIHVVDTAGQYAVYDLLGKNVYAAHIDAMQKFLSYYISICQDPIIGLYGGKLFVWNEDLMDYDTTSHMANVWQLDMLFRSFDIGNLHVELDYHACYYYANRETFYIILDTEKGLYCFKYIVN